jgi:hypothetical protein
VTRILNLGKRKGTVKARNIDTSKVKLSFGEQVFMRSVLVEAGRAEAGTLVSFDHTEGRAVSGLAKKGLVVRLAREVQITDSGAAWLAAAAD